MELDKILKFAEENKIYIVAILPPFANKVHLKMSKSGNYDYLKEIYSKLKPIFDKYKYEIYDFSTVSLFGSSDSETIDGFHGGEVAYQRLLIKMLNSGSKLNLVANEKKLKQDLSKKINDYLIYEY